MYFVDDVSFIHKRLKLILTKVSDKVLPASGLKTLYSKVFHRQSLFKVNNPCSSFAFDFILKPVIYSVYGHLNNAKQ